MPSAHHTDERVLYDDIEHNRGDTQLKLHCELNYIKQLIHYFKQLCEIHYAGSWLEICWMHVLHVLGSGLDNLRL